MPLMKPINVGVVGCGYWGPNLVRNLRQSADAGLKIICDASEQRLAHMRRLASRCRHHAAASTTCLKIRTLTPWSSPRRCDFITRWPRPALNAGKHVFIEKPMARTEAEAEELSGPGRAAGPGADGRAHLSVLARRAPDEGNRFDAGDIGEVQYISARRLNLGLFQKDINVAWDLAPHDISIILHLLDELPVSVSCQGSSHVTPGIEDVTMMYLNFAKNRCALIQNSWLDPKKVRQMTVVGSRRMIVYDDTEPLKS